MLYKIGDTVRIRKSLYHTGIINNGFFKLCFEPDFRSILYTENYKQPKKRKETFMSLLKRLLDKDTALIEKHCMDEDGDLEFNSLVQEALLSLPEFKKALVEICKKEEKKDK